MKTTIVTLLAAMLITGTAAAQDRSGGDADAEKRLQAAQQRLEAAAREVAELSAELRGPEFQRRIEMFMPSPRRAMLGVNLGAEEAGGGVRVNSASPGGPAAEAGVKAGDVIVAIDGKKVATGRELVKVMEDVEPGQKLALELRRDGKPVKVTVEARSMDRVIFAGRDGALPSVVIGALPAMPELRGLELGGGQHWLLGAWGDAEFVTLTPGLGRYFGTDKGVLVARAPEDATLGLQDGDVIVAIGGREPQNARHAMRILRSYQPGESVEFRVLRDRRAQTLTAKVPERAEGDVLRHREVYRQRIAPPEAPGAPKPPRPPKPAGDPTST
ncbi:MAG: PDZ domain-containing protein [Steroidobacteraceae bacterium]|nr:PDZ domain-containing protein [Steroidobacteraceae bacterium]